jgi:isoleucyl-tRNA synthetase
MDLIKQVAESYRKIRNTFKFMLGNLSDGSLGKFNYAKDKANELSLIDKFVVEKLHLVVNNFIECFDNYDFAGAVSEMLNFMSIDLSSFYLDLSKDILYCETYESLRRKQVQNVLYKVLDTVVRLLTPIIPHTMDELYAELTGTEKSAQLLSMPVRESVNEYLLKEFTLLMNLRDDVLKAIEVKRGEGTIKSSQEVALTLEVVDENVKKTFDKLSNLEQTRLFIVSSVKEDALDDNKLEVSKVKVDTHTGCRCERCWNKFEESELKDNLCPRCAAAWDFYKDKVNE